MSGWPGAKLREMARSRAIFAAKWAENPIQLILFQLEVIQGKTSPTKYLVYAYMFCVTVQPLAKMFVYPKNAPQMWDMSANTHKNTRTVENMNDRVSEFPIHIRKILWKWENHRKFLLPSLITHPTRRTGGIGSHAMAPKCVLQKMRNVHIDSLWNQSSRTGGFLCGLDLSYQNHPKSTTATFFRPKKQGFLK